MPELPEVEALALFVADNATGATVERAELGSLSALKTYAPPLDALIGRTVAGASRRGKYLCIDIDGLWLVTHLARAGWLHWRDPVPAGRARPGRARWSCRVGLSSGAGFDLTEQGARRKGSLCGWWATRRPLKVWPGSGRIR